MAAILQQSKVSPPADAVSELCVPLLFFDLLWYGQAVHQFVRFFDSRFSKLQFLDVVLPALKHSLSLTLAHFLPLAGNIFLPRSSSLKPTVQFHPGQDYVSLIVCESKSNNFNHLTGNHPRDCSDFYEFVPESPPSTSPEFIKIPVLALKVTFFPGCGGISIGSAVSHMFADATTVYSFFRAWALIHRKKVGKVEEAKLLLQEKGLFPFYDRTSFIDINGLDSKSWSLITASPDSHHILSSNSPRSGEKLRSTFVLKKEEIQNLKNFVLQKLTCSDVANHLSSFSVVSAFIWSSFAKSDEMVPVDETDYFSYIVDCRGRVGLDSDPVTTLPPNYLGNCCLNFMISMKNGELKGDEGFARAAVFISQSIDKMMLSMHNEKGIPRGAEAWLPLRWKRAGKRRMFCIGGSLKFDLYEVDFGWGRPTAVETLGTDNGTLISLRKSRWLEGGVEIVLSKPKAEMEAFTAVFRTSLNDICQASCCVSKI